MFKTFVYQTFTELKLYFRIPMSLLWIILFPLLQLMLFAVLFGGFSPIQVAVGVSLEDQSDAGRQFFACLRQVEVLQVTTSSFPNLRSQMENGKITAILVIPDGFGKKVEQKNADIRLYYNPVQGPINEILFSVMQEIVRRTNEKIVGERPPIVIQKETITGSTEKIGYTAHLLPGLVGLVLLSIAIFSIAIPITTARERGYLKRISVTPLPKWIYISSFLAAGSLVAWIQSGILIFAGIAIYNLQIRGNPVHIAIWLALGIVTFMAIGVFLGAISPNPVTANIIGFSVFFPLLFLSEIYFPITNLPYFLQETVKIFPLIHFLNVFRKIMNEGLALWSFWKEACIMIGWTIVPSVLACIYFRWTPGSFLQTKSR